MKPWQTARVREVRGEGRERVFVGEKNRKKAAHRWREWERKLEKSERTWEGPSHRVRRRVKRASIPGQDEMVDCVWTASRKYLEWIGRASRPLRASLLIMAVGAVGTILTTERTLLIRRHVTAHPCRVNTLHGNDWTLFLSLTHKHTQISQLCLLS